MHKMLQSMLDGMTLEILEDEWDKQPALAIALDDGSDRVKFIDTGFPDVFWSVGHPVDVIRTLGKLIDQFGIPPWFDKEEGDFAGVLLMNEGWALKLPKDMGDDAAAKELAWCEENSIADHPYGREVKIMSGVGLGERRFAISYTRGDADPEYVVDSDDEAAVTYSGRLYDVLNEFFHAVEGKLE